VDKRNSDNSQQDEFTLQVGGNDVPVLHVGGNDVLQSDKRNGSIAEATTSTSEKDMGTSKIKTQAVKVGKTQSGPLVPGTVLGHYLPERGRLFERYVAYFILYHCFLLLYWVIIGSFRDWNEKKRDRIKWKDEK
jgi:hypothetical protein